MRSAKILFKGEDAGIITQFDDGTFSFRYHDDWFNNNSKSSISLTLPKSQAEYRSEFLFPFFYNMLPEGSNKKLVCKMMRIDAKDDFGLLLAAARYDTIGAVRIIQIR